VPKSGLFRPHPETGTLGLLASRLFSLLCVPGPSWGTALFMNHHLHPIEVGKYRVSPVATQLDDGGFAASVSIRSGKGSASMTACHAFPPCSTMHLLPCITPPRMQWPGSASATPPPMPDAGTASDLFVFILKETSHGKRRID
jgi:hypothetical protein